MEIQKNILLAPYTSFKIGGEARFFTVVKNIEDLRLGVNFAKQNSLPIFILGKGSNILISDNGFSGLVLKIEIDYLETKLPSEDFVEIVVGAGMILDELIEKMTKKKLWGIENLSYIPGTVGASAVQNAGAFGVEVKDTILWIEVFDINTGKTQKLNNKECYFAYRNSIFKEEPNWVIIKIVFRLKIKKESNYSYNNLENLKNKKDLTSQDVRDKIIEIRKKITPRIEGLGSAGSFFKNPIISKKEFKELKEKFPESPSFMEGERIKIPIAWFIDKFGWKGYFDGEVGIYDKHALMLVNKGKGTCDEVKNLAQKISDDIYKKTGLKLETEVVFV
ncbi:MAG: UDP-N-acetylmuramate dehydrogenase [Candidatus Pacebacteria bacterium]|nr:UDP-N-acetylmuramate dehydrogenase [Candidatus Paceibacterota bacterium]